MPRRPSFKLVITTERGIYMEELFVGRHCLAKEDKQLLILWIEHYGFNYLRLVVIVWRDHGLDDVEGATVVV